MTIEIHTGSDGSDGDLCVFYREMCSLLFLLQRPPKCSMLLVAGLCLGQMGSLYTVWVAISCKTRFSH